MSTNYLNLPHFDNSAFARSALAEQVLAGVDAFALESVQGFTLGNFAVVDVVGSEAAEKAYIDESPIAPNLLVASGLQKAHVKGAYVMLTPYDQVAIYRATGATEPSEGSFSLLATVPLDFEALATFYEDAGAPANAWYKWKYKNSVSASLSDFSAATIEGGAASVLYATPLQVMGDLGIAKDGALIRECIEAISDLIDQACDRGGRLYHRTAQDVMDMESGAYNYRLNSNPVVSITSLEYKDSSGNWIADDRNRYAKYDRIELDMPYHTFRRNALRVTYVAGFFASDAVPRALNMYVRELAREMYQGIRSKMRKDIASKKIGNYQVTYKNATAQDASSHDVFRERIAESAIVQEYKPDLIFGAITSRPKESGDLNSIFL